MDATALSITVLLRMKVARKEENAAAARKLSNRGVLLLFVFIRFESAFGFFRGRFCHLIHGWRLRCLHPWIRRHPWSRFQPGRRSRLAYLRLLRCRTRSLFTCGARS